MCPSCCDSHPPDSYVCNACGDSLIHEIEGKQSGAEDASTDSVMTSSLLNLAARVGIRQLSSTAGNIVMREPQTANVTPTV